MLSAFEGGATLHLCGAPRMIRFNWQKLDQFRAQYGADFQTRINRALDEIDLEIIAHVLSIGSGVEVEKIRMDSPPIFPALASIVAAFNAAYHGPEGPPKRRPLELVAVAVAKMRSWIVSRLGRKPAGQN